MEERLTKEEMNQYIKICPKVITKAEDMLMNLDEIGLLDHEIYYQYSHKPQINAIYIDTRIVSKSRTFESGKLIVNTETEQVITIIYPIKTKWWKSGCEKSIQIPVICFYDDKELEIWIDKKKEAYIKSKIMKSKNYKKYLKLKEKYSKFKL